MRLVLILALLLSAHMPPAWAGGKEDMKAALEAGGKGNHEQAIQLFSRAIQSGDIKGKELAVTYYNRGQAFALMKRTDKAVDDFTQAIKLDPSLARAYDSRGKIYKQKGDLDKAIDDFSNALKIVPFAAGVLTRRGSIYSDKGQYDKAIADFSQAVKNWPNYTNAYFQRGFTYEKMKKPKLAIVNYHIVMRLLLNEREALRRLLQKRAVSK